METKEEFLKGIISKGDIVNGILHRRRYFQNSRDSFLNNKPSVEIIKALEEVKSYPVRLSLKGRKRSFEKYRL